MKALITEHGEPLEGVKEMLLFLKQQNKKVGLATSSYEMLIETVLRVLDIEEYFHHTHSAEHEDFGKPHPAVYLSVAETLNVHASRCLVIEDSLNGIISAKAARMKVVCIPEKTHHPEPKLIIADHHYDSMSQLLDAFKLAN